MIQRLVPLLLLVGLLPASAQEAPVDDPEQLAELAVQSQPTLDAARARIDALQSMASASRLWADPMVAVELSNLPVTAPWINQHPMAGIQLKLQQRFLAPGQAEARSVAADARTEAAEAVLPTLANELRGEVRERYWDLALVRQLRGLTDQQVTELDGLIESVQVRYQVGAANQHDLLQLQLKRDRLAELLPDLDARAAMLQSGLNGALARDPATPIRTPGSTPAVPLPGTADERREALQRHPALSELRAAAAAERAESARARVESVPGPTAWLGYRVRSVQTNGDPGTNFVTAGVSVPLPAASARRWSAAAGASDARARAAEEAAEGRAVRLAARLESLEAQHARATDRATAYRDALETSARAALESTLAAYQVDRAQFSDLIRAQLDLIDVQRQRVTAEADAARARASVRTLIAGVE